MHKKYAVILKELDFALILPSTNGKQQIYHFEQIIWDSEGRNQIYAFHKSRSSIEN